MRPTIPRPCSKPWWFEQTNTARYSSVGSIALFNRGLGNSPQRFDPFVSGLNDTIYGPQGMSSDAATGDLWISNCRNTNDDGNTVTVFPKGDQDSAKDYTAFKNVTLDSQDVGFSPKPFGMTVDPDSVAWVAGNNINQVAGIDRDGKRIALFGNKFDEDCLAGNNDCDDRKRRINRIARDGGYSKRTAPPAVTSCRATPVRTDS